MRTKCAVTWIAGIGEQPFVADGDYDAQHVHAAFLAVSQALQKEVLEFVAESLESYAHRES